MGKEQYTIEQANRDWLKFQRSLVNIEILLTELSGEFEAVRKLWGESNAIRKVL